MGIEQFYIILCIPPVFLLGGGGFKKEGFNGISILERGCWERGSDFFQKGYNFYIKNKLKSEIFKDKKVYKQKYFSVLTKNLFKPGNFN